jgi:hypothetical protein
MRLSLLTLLASTAATALANTIACNGNLALCDRPYPNISWIGSHDSAFIGALPSDNQLLPLSQQLDSGIRFLQSQTHRTWYGRLEMCHTSCWLADGGSVVSYLSTVKSWLDDNPQQVVTVLLTNGDNRPVKEFGDAVRSAGLAGYAFVPGAGGVRAGGSLGGNGYGGIAMSEWPTLREMITANKRFVLFLDYGADPTIEPFVLDEFAYFWETPYDTTDPAFPQCDVDRPPNGPTEGRMGIMNHMLDVAVGGVSVPDNLETSQTNSKDSIMKQAGRCVQQHGSVPKVVLVDYVNVGDVWAAQDELNGLL